jgi:acetylglutamate kinase
VQHKNIQTVKTLLEALPYIQQFRGQTIVIKYGGSAQTSDELKKSFARDISLLQLVGIKPIIVHGGGKDITKTLEKLNITSEFLDGFRVTSAEALEVVEMVLFGSINSELVSFLNAHKAKAIGLSGKSGAFVRAKSKGDGQWGYTGEPTEVDGEMINKLLNDNFVPVIAPIADGHESGHPGFNINADTMASAVAGAVGAKKVLFMTDTSGVLDEEKNLISSLTKSQVLDLIEKGVISGGMIPKVEACLEALDYGVTKAHIIDGRVEHAILLELFTDYGIGTEVSL